jgi:hemolysin activation/secretion protein
MAQPALPGIGSPIEQLAPRPNLTVAPGLAAPAPATAPREVTGRPVAIGSVSVEGATAYSPAVTAGWGDGLTGSAVTPTAIEAARLAIVDRYRRDGYVYTVVDAVISRGNLRFQVTEGRIAAVKLDGDIGPAGVQVLRFLNHLMEKQPIDVATLERWLLLAADVPGVTIRSTLSPSLEEPGALTLIAKVERARVSGLLTADNRAFPQTGPEQALAILTFNSFTEYGERTQLSLYHAFNNTQIFGQAATELYLGGSGLKLKIFAGSGDAAPSGNLRQIGYDGTTTVFGALFTYPLIRVRSQSLNIFGGFDGFESKITTNLGVGGTTTTNSTDNLRILRLGAEYALLDTVAFGRTAINGASGRLSQGIEALGASARGSTLAARLNEKPDFTKFNGEISRNQTLFSLWDDSSVALQGALGGQYSNDILPPAEKFYLGGAHFNRGYYWGQVTGDSALTASAELQLNTPIPLPDRVPLDLSAQFYGFYDWGQTWESVARDPNITVRSTGVGVRFYLTKYTEFDFEGVTRLNRYPNGSGPNVSALKSNAFYWQVLARF